MNHSYRSIWNAALGTWVAAPETARAGKNSAKSTVRISGGNTPAGAGALVGRVRAAAAAAALLCLAGISPAAWAECITAGSIVTCTGVPTGSGSFNNFSSAADNLTVKVGYGAEMNTSAGSHVIKLTGVNLILENSGTIDPVLGSLVSDWSGGAFLGNGATGDVSVFNEGTIRGTGRVLGPTLTSIDGLAIAVNNGAGGMTKILNDGTITSTKLGGDSITWADTPVVGIYGGSQVEMTNGATGFIYGRVAFEASTAGNRFTNAGTISGSVSMGAGSSNTFTAVTGSLVSDGDGRQTSSGLGGLAGIKLSFAPTGTVDGGAGGSNHLMLQNAIGGGGGSGTSGEGTASSATYINFNNLTVESGTWILDGPLVSGATTLKGGVARFNDNATFGSGVITSEGGTLEASVDGLNIGNLISLVGAGLTVQGNNATTLSGAISGGGGLSKTGTGSLTLGGANTGYTGTTTLSAGSLLVSNDHSLGSGALNTAAGTRLDSTADVTLANNIGLDGALNVLGSHALTLGGELSGAGGITKSGTASLTLSGNNRNSGNTLLNGGSLFVGNNAALGTGALITAAGTTLDASTAVALANAVSLGGNLNVGGSADLSLGGLISGAGSLVKNGTANLTLNGSNSFSGGTFLNAGTLTLGNANGLGRGALTVHGAATLDNSTVLDIGNAITLNAGLTVAGNYNLSLGGTIDGAGSLTKNGWSDLRLEGNNTFTGALNIVSGSVTADNIHALGNTSGANISPGASLHLSRDASLAALSGGGSVQLMGNNTLTVGGIDSSSTFAGNLSDSGGLIKVGTGTLELTGSNGFAGNTAINGGTLNLGGWLRSSQVNVNTGATFTGNGLAQGAVNVGSGGHLALSTGKTLSAGSLTLAAGSNVDVALAGPGTTPLMSIGGNLTLDGYLNVTDAGGFGVGVYRLFNYSGALTDQGLNVASVPVGYALGDLKVQTGAAQQINIEVSDPNSNMRYWDGDQTITTGVVDGGSGTWDAAGKNWTDANGFAQQRWADGFAVFQGQAGTIAVEGTQRFAGMQFLTDGYKLVNGTAGQLTAVNGTGGTTAVRVDPDVTASIDANIDGSGILNKLDTGTLVLNGANTYSGGTQLDGGKIVVGSNTALGSGTLTAKAGTQLDGNAEVTLGNAATLNGSLTVLGSHALRLNGEIGGTGGLIKTGTANLTLGGNNAFSGTVALNAGGLILASNSALGSGTLNAAGGTTLGASTQVTVSNAVNLSGSLGIGGTADLTLAGTVNGGGSLSKHGAANLTLSGINSFMGGTTLNAGTLTLGTGNALGSGALTVAGAANLDSTSSMALGNDIHINANLSLAGSKNLTLGGVIAGAGTLTKDGVADVTLSGNNRFSGIFDLRRGSLTTSSVTALGSNATLKLGGGAQLNLGASGSLASLTGLGTARIDTGNTLRLGGSDVSSTFAGVFSGSGGLTKLGNGTLSLSGVSDLTGDTHVNAGSLEVNGSLASGNVRVHSGATLTGSGKLGGAVAVADGGHLAGAAGSSLSLGSLVFNGDSHFDVRLGAPVAGGGNALVKVDGNLTLDGSLQVSDIGGFGNGVYRLIDYSGGLTDNGMVIGSLPGGVAPGDLTLQTALDQQINLLVATPGATVQFWDGNQTVGNGVIDGGNGTWGSNGETHWTDVNGMSNQAWVSSFAVFQGTAGTVTVNGAQNTTGMQFAVDGYSLQNGTAGSLNLVNGSLGNAALRVDPNATATIGVAINGTGILGKYDAGTLVLNAANGYRGGTALHGGKIVVGNNMALGSGLLTAAHGTALDANTAVSLDNKLLLNGGLTVVGSNGLTLAGTVSGTGGLIKTGAASLTLEGHNTYSGGTLLAGGSTVVTNNSALGSGALTVNAHSVLDSTQAVSLANQVVLNADLTLTGTHDLTLDGNISGAGGLTKNGVSTLTLNGTNTYTGETHVNTGTLALGAGSSLATRGMVHLASGARFDLSAGAGMQTIGTLTGDGTVNLGANALTAGASADGVFSGSLDGTGRFIKDGSGTQTLTGLNTYTGGTLVAAGTLQAGSPTALVQNTAYQVQSGATLDLNHYALQVSSLSGAGHVALGAAVLTVHTETGTVSSFGGEIQGSGHLVKQGEGTLDLNGASTLTGGVKLKQGRINLGHAQGLGTGLLSMDDGTSLGLTSNGMTVANNLHMTGSKDPVIDTGANHATWAGAITGAGLLTKQGTGTLTLTSAGNTYTGATEVAQGTFQAGAANTFSSSSAHTVASGAVLDLAGYHQTLASLNNSGTVKLGGSTPSTVLKVTGAYVGNNGQLGLSTVLGADGSATDKLVLSGSSAVASGNTKVQITNAAGLGALTTGNGIEIIGTENGASLQPGSFTLAGDHVDVGAYEYRLKQTAQGAALHSTTTTPTTPTPTPTTAYRAQVPLLSALPAQLRQADMAMLADLRKRMGDEGTQAMASSDAGAGRRVWGRVLRTAPTILQHGSVSPESRGHLSGFQAGLDLYADSSIKAGIYVGQLEGSMGVKGFASGVERKDVGSNYLRTRYLGMYGTWQAASGLYADAVLQGADYRSNLRTESDKAQASTKGSGWMASLEMAQPLALSSHWQIEPQAQIIYRQLSIDDTALSHATVKSQADDDWTVRLGARIKGNFATSSGVLQPYGRIHVYKASHTTDIASFAAPGGTTAIHAKGGYTATEMAAGASLRINPRTSFYAELGKLWANGGDSRVKSGVQASIGVKAQW